MERRDYVLSCFDTFSKVLGTLLHVLWMFKDMFRTKNEKPRTKREEGEGKTVMVICRHLKDEGNGRAEGFSQWRQVA